MRSILLTNDDGIAADGLLRLAREAVRFGQVCIIAPDSQRSAASHSITLREHIDVYPYEYPVDGVTAYSCSGTPADCVRIACNGFLDEKPQLVLSGINLGYNSATDIQYSATVGAAFEAVFQGVPGVALSEGFTEEHGATDRYLGEIMEEAVRFGYRWGEVLNINFPGCRADECRGILRDRTASHGMFYRDRYIKERETDRGGVRLMVRGEYNEDAEEGTDFKAIVDRYVSVGIVHNVC